MDHAPPKTPSGFWRAVGGNAVLFKDTREKLAKELAAKDKLYRWDLSTEHQDMIVRLAMLSVASVAFELRQQFINEGIAKEVHEAPTAVSPVETKPPR